MSLASLAQQLLDSALASLIDPPETVYRVHGDPAWDGCDQLTVHVDETDGVTVTSGDFTPTIRQSCVAVPVAHLVVTLVRCGVPIQHSDGNPPDAADIDEHAAAAMNEGEELLRGIMGDWANGTLFDSIPCQNVQFDPMLPLHPRGGLSGWQLGVRIAF